MAYRLDQLGGVVAALFEHLVETVEPEELAGRALGLDDSVRVKDDLVAGLQGQRTLLIALLCRDTQRKVGHAVERSNCSIRAAFQARRVMACRGIGENP